uniref:Mitochondrial inner membrane protease subunit 2 n=1 Tax=Esox lucius TaxID=8010 RepID=A0AAY5KEN0_ESOLU
MAQQAGAGRRYVRAFVSGFFVAVPVTVTVLDRFAYVARVEGASMQPSLNPEGNVTGSDVVLLNRWSVRNYQVRRGDIVSVLLVNKLHDLGISPSLCNWTLDVLTNRPQSFRLDNFTSSTLILNTGVPQGCVLSPLHPVPEHWFSTRLCAELLPVLPLHP